MSAKYRPLLLALAGLIALPLVMHALGLTVNTASMVVIFAIAVLGLNMLVGYTGLTWFGHGAWFGVTAYAAGLAQLHWFPNQILLPIILARCSSRDCLRSSVF